MHAGLHVYVHVYTPDDHPPTPSVGQSWKSLSIWLFSAPLCSAWYTTPHSQNACGERERERGVMCATHTTRESVWQLTKWVHMYICIHMNMYMYCHLYCVYMYILYACIYSAYIGNLYSIIIYIYRPTCICTCVYTRWSPNHPPTHTHLLPQWVNPVNLIDFSSSVQCLIYHTS